MFVVVIYFFSRTNRRTSLGLDILLCIFGLIKVCFPPRGQLRKRKSTESAPILRNFHRSQYFSRKQARISRFISLVLIYMWRCWCSSVGNSLNGLKRETTKMETEKAANWKPIWHNNRDSTENNACTTYGRWSMDGNEIQLNWGESKCGKCS